MLPPGLSELRPWFPSTDLNGLSRFELETTCTLFLNGFESFDLLLALSMMTDCDTLLPAATPSIPITESLPSTTTDVSPITFL